MTQLKVTIFRYLEHNKILGNYLGRRFELEIQKVLAQTNQPIIAVFSENSEKFKQEPLSLLGLDQSSDKVEFRRFVNYASSFITSQSTPFETALLTLPSEQFSIAIIQSNTKLLTNTWGISYIQNVVQSLKSDGLLTIAVNNIELSYALSAYNLVRYLNLHLVCLHKGYAVFKVSNSHMSHPKSVLTWFRQNNVSFLLTDLLLQQDEINSRDIPPQYGLDDFFPNSASDIPDYKASSASAKRRSNRDKSDNTNYEYSRLAKRYSYLINGVSYKSSSITFIINDLVGYKKGLYLCDLGGGIGFLGIELILDKDSPIKKVTNVDLNIENRRLASEVYFIYKSDLKGAIEFWIGSFVDYEYQNQPDVVTMIGSLLYANKIERHTTIQKAWNALKPNGIIIVHENIKNDRFTDDYEVMFTIEEIDELLESFAPVKRYSSHSFAKLTKEQAGDKSIFRVIQKI